MKTPRTINAKLFVAGFSGLVVATVLIAGGAAYLMRSKPAAVLRLGAGGEQQTVDALVDAMQRSDSEAVLKYVDIDKVFENLYRHVLETGLQKQLTDEEFNSFFTKNASLLPQARKALVQGITTKSDRDAANGASLLSALVHLSEGKIEKHDDGGFSVVFTDGSSLLFERRGDGWKAVSYIGIDSRLAEYQKSAAAALKTSLVDSAQKAQAEKDAAGAAAGN